MLRNPATLLLIALTGACAPLPPSEGPLRPWEVAEVRHRAERLRASRWHVRNPALYAYLGGWLQRLDPQRGPGIDLVLLDLPGLRADLIGGRLLRLELGLLLELHDDAELAFVLAHELAHAQLGHVAAQRASDWNGAIAEREADAAARDRLVALGLDPDAGRRLLARLARRAEGTAAELITDRIEALAVAAGPGAHATARLSDELERMLAPYRAGRTPR